ncbi:MAG: hypothetical protein JRG91_18370, partial [Deltaproteobacteria bacterium]|nr:hypothetical protein [Deltaproteobacteria bacterium]
MMRNKLLLALVLIAVAGGVLALSTGRTVPAAEGQEGAKYKGAKSCKMCHDKVHETAKYNPWTAWEAMKHAKAFDVLTDEDVASGKDPQGRACVECHTTGYGKGGFVSKDKTP